MEDEPGVAPRVTRRFNSFIVPLQHPLGLGERALLLGYERARYIKDLRTVLFRVHPVRLPSSGGLYLVGVQDNEKFEVPQRVAGEAGVGAADGEVLSEDKGALYAAVLHA